MDRDYAGTFSISDHNNLYERLNGEFRDRLDRIRGLNANTPGMVRRIIIHHNFFRPHSGIGDMTPAHVVGIHICVEPNTSEPGDNTVRGSGEWITMIHNAALHTS